MTKIYLYHEYDNAEAYQAHLRAGGKCHDACVVGGVLFTQDEYDMKGATITYGNRKKHKAMMVATSDRYDKRSGFTDAIVSVYPMVGYRADVAYLE